MIKIDKFEGLVAAPFTPMDKKGNLNPDVIPVYYEFLEKNGITGAFVNGSTGEGPSLSTEEKRISAAKWAGCLKSGGKVRIINLVGGTSHRECIENAIFSFESGISAIAVVAPYYFKPADDAQLAEFVTLIGETVPEMPVYFYHIPVLTGVNMPMAGFLKKITSMLPNFAGIKYTHEDFMDFLSCIRYNDGMYDMLWGRDECLLSALALGAKGAVGSTYNYAAPLYHDLLKAFDEGNMDDARALQQKSVEIVRLLGKYGGMATGKAFMKLAGIDCGKFRPPVKNMSDESFNDFVRDVSLLNMENLFSRI
jgi:N-acetylneuraminate lyase